MLCYVPYCVNRVPYFPVFTKCGFEEEQGGTVDCIQTINMSGINELLVSQGYGSAVLSRHHHHRPESLQELEELLEIPPPQAVSEVELDSRFQYLCNVIQKARDTSSTRRVGEGREDEEQEENNPFQELQVQLQKAKDRFHSRIAAAGGRNNSKLVHGRRKLFKKTMKSDSSMNNNVNPFQELRDAFRMARRHFIPLIDQYISNGNINENIHKRNNRNSNTNTVTVTVTGQGGEAPQGSGGHCDQPTTSSGGDVSHLVAAKAVDFPSTIQSTGYPMEKDYDYPKPGPISIACNNKEISSQTIETGSVPISLANAAADDCTTILLVNSMIDCSESFLPSNACSCNEMSSGAASPFSVMIMREEMEEKPPKI